MKHAENCYSEQGKICYQQIENNGGKATKFRGPAKFKSSGPNTTVDAFGNVLNSVLKTDGQGHRDLL